MVTAREILYDKEVLLISILFDIFQLSRKESALSTNSKAMRDLEFDLNTLERGRLVDSSSQSRKWEEFGNLADSMKSLSRYVSSLST